MSRSVDPGDSKRPASDAVRYPSRRSVANLLLAAIVMAAMTALVYRHFLLLGVSNVWEDDGLSQHFPALYYFNVWLRGVLQAPRLGVPLWSWNLGLGADIIGTLSFYAIGDPFAAISLAFPMRAMEDAYFAMLLARVIMAGLFAFLYLRKMGAKAFAGTVGALIYVFATFTFVAGLRHPFFVTGLGLLPAVLLGLEYALRDRRYAWFCVSVLLAASGSFYFFYMITIIGVIYSAARYTELTPKGERRRHFVGTASRVAFYYLLGVLLASPVLLPTIHAFLGSWRATGEHPLPLLYLPADYGAFLATLALPVSARHSTYLGFGILGIMLLPVMFMRRGRNLSLKVMLIVLPVFAAVPYFGSVFNGLTFPNNRFVFAWGLFLGLGVATVLSDAEPLSSRELRWTGLAWAACLVPAATFGVVAGWPSLSALVVPAVTGVLAWALLAAESSRTGSDRPWGPRGLLLGDEWRVSAARWGVLAVLVANLSGNAAYLYAGKEGVLGEYLARGSVLARFEENPGAHAKSLAEDDPAYRIENADRVAYGDSLVQGYPGTAFYFSIMDGCLTEYLLENDVRANGFSFRYAGFDDRAALTTLSGVKYYIADKDHAEFVPFGFEATRGAGDAMVYENRYAVPLGFVYDAVIPRAVYDGLSPLERQQALVQGAVVDDGDCPNVHAIVPATRVVEVPYTVAGARGARFDADESRIVSTAPTSSMTFDIAPVPDAELYVALEDFDYAIPGRYIPERRIETVYSAGGAKKAHVWFTPTSPYYWGNRSQLVNLGYKSAGAKRVRIDLTGAGTLSFKSLRVLAVPMADYPKQAGRLQAAAMRDIVVGANRVTGTVYSAGNGVLYLSIPYSTGWTAEVDGRPVRTLKVNTTFTGVEVEPGTHSVELRYTTPWLVEGITLSGIALIALVLATAMRAARRRTHLTSNGRNRRQSVDTVDNRQPRR